MKSKKVTLVNSINGESWYCDDFSKIVRTVDGEDFVLVYKPDNAHRKYIMRKNVLKIDRSRPSRKEVV